MSCFSCFSSQKSKKHSKGDDSHRSSFGSPKSPENMETTSKSNQGENEIITAQPFTFRDLAAATKNFRQECLLGEGGFGKVYKGTLQATGQVVAVKQLDRNAMLENKNFLVEVAKLSHIQHPNLVNLIGYCADGDQRLLVYEFMPHGSIEDHLHGEGKVLDWITRMKIAYGAAQGLEYLHDKTSTPIIYRDLKSSNVLLDEQLDPKLSDIGLDKLEPLTDKIPMQSREMGTYGYSAPEFSRSGSLTPVSDVYSLGVVLLELITGRRVMDTTKSVDEQNLVSWAQPIFKDPKRYPELADPMLKKRFPERDLNQAVGIIAMCLQDEAGARPMMSDVVTALSFLSMATPESCNPPNTQDSESEHESNQDDDDDYDYDDDDDDDKYDDDDVDDDMHNISGSRSSSNRSRSINSNGESRSTLDYSRRSSYGSYSREEMSINDSSVRRKESQSSISQNYSEEFEGSSARSTSRKSSVGKSSRKNGDDGNVSNRSRKSLSRKASCAGDESHSSVSSKKNSRRTKKANENPHSRTGVSQDEIQLVHNH